MKTLIKFVIFTAITCIFAFNAHAVLNYDDIQARTVRHINITGFLDYPPFGWTEHPYENIHGRFTTIYQSMIDTFQKENNLKATFVTNKPDYDHLVQATRSGEIDIILGMYHETLLYNGLDIVYPSILANPLSVFMLPHRIDEVTNLNDIKKLKGIRPKQDRYSDFVRERIKEYNLETADTSYEMFEKLFTGKVDYILAGHYYVMIEASKLGLRNKISISKQAVWNMPLFIGVSKLSKNRKMIMQKLTSYSENKDNQAKIKELLINMINEIAEQHQSIIPPTFGLEKKRKK